MGIQILPSKLVSQPQFPVALDVSNSLAIGVTFATGGDWTMRDEVSRVIPVARGNASTGIGQQGRQFNFALRSGTITNYTYSGANVYDLFSNLTVGLNCTVNAIITPSQSGLTQSILSTRESLFGWALLLTNSNTIRLVLAANADIMFETTETLPIGTATTISVVSLMAGKTNGLVSSDVQIYFNGKAQTVTLSGGSTLAGRTSDNVEPFVVASSEYYGNVDFGGSITHLSFVRRAYSSSEAAAFYFNPWQIFKGPPERLWVADFPTTVITSPGPAQLNFVGKFANIQLSTNISCNTPARFNLAGKFANVQISTVISCNVPARLTSQGKVANIQIATQVNCTVARLQSFGLVAGITTVGTTIVATAGRLNMAGQFATVQTNIVTKCADFDHTYFGVPRSVIYYGQRRKVSFPDE